MFLNAFPTVVTFPSKVHSIVVMYMYVHARCDVIRCVRCADDGEHEESHEDGARARQGAGADAGSQSAGHAPAADHRRHAQVAARPLR